MAGKSLTLFILEVKEDGDCGSTVLNKQCLKPFKLCENKLIILNRINSVKLQYLKLFNCTPKRINTEYNLVLDTNT